MRVEIQISNKQILGLVIVLVFIVIIGYTESYRSGNPIVMGHSLDEIELCPPNKLLKTKSDGNAWICVDESDPTVTASVKDGVDWNELTNIPAGFADGVDDIRNVPYCSLTDCQDIYVERHKVQWFACPPDRPVIGALRLFYDDYGYFAIYNSIRCCSIACNYP